MGLQAAEAANMWRVQSLSAADGIMSVTAHNALRLVLPQACTRTHTHAPIPPGHRTVRKHPSSSIIQSGSCNTSIPAPD